MDGGRGGPKLSNQNIITEIDNVREQAAREAQYEAMRARDRVTAALQAQNERKVEEGKVPTSQQWCRDGADKAAAKAHKKVRREADLGWERGHQTHGYSGPRSADGGRRPSSDEGLCPHTVHASNATVASRPLGARDGDQSADLLDQK